MVQYKYKMSPGSLATSCTSFSGCLECDEIYPFLFGDILGLDDPYWIILIIIYDLYCIKGYYAKEMKEYEEYMMFFSILETAS